MQAEPVYRYKVFYQGKPGQNIKKGVHGAFDHLDDAIKGAEKCAKWFNEEKKSSVRLNDLGKKETVIETFVRDKVNVEIHEYKDGFYSRVLNVEGEPCEERSSIDELQEGKSKSSSSTVAELAGSPR